MSMERVEPTTDLGKILVWCSQQKATDLHAQADRRYSIRVDGKLERIERENEIDLSFLCEQVRYRANFSKQQGK